MKKGRSGGRQGSQNVEREGRRKVRKGRDREAEGRNSERWTEVTKVGEGRHGNKNVKPNRRKGKR